MSLRVLGFNVPIGHRGFPGIHNKCIAAQETGIDLRRKVAGQAKQYVASAPGCVINTEVRMITDSYQVLMACLKH